MLNNYRFLTSPEYCVGGFELFPKSLPHYLHVSGYRTVYSLSGQR